MAFFIPNKQNVFVNALNPFNKPLPMPRCIMNPVPESAQIAYAPSKPIAIKAKGRQKKSDKIAEAKELVKNGIDHLTQSKPTLSIVRDYFTERIEELKADSN